MRILAIVQGEYGQRHVANIRETCPSEWSVETWTAPKLLPAVIDEPEEFLPGSLPEVDLLLALQEDARAAQLIPDVARLCKARAVIAPVDREEWLPRGLCRQLAQGFAQGGIPAVFPKPFCSLTEEISGLRGFAQQVSSTLIAEFARHFGRPSFEIALGPEGRQISRVTTLRDACCGCARFVAEKLVGIAADDAAQVAGLAHHHYPCMASMGIDPDFGDTLMHVSGNIMKEAVGCRIAAFTKVAYAEPDTRIGGTP